MSFSLREVIPFLHHIVKSRLLYWLDLIELPIKLPDKIKCEVIYVGHASRSKARIIEPKGFEELEVNIIPQGQMLTSSIGTCSSMLVSDLSDEDLKALGVKDCPFYFLKNSGNPYRQVPLATLCLYLPLDELEELQKNLQNLDEFYTALHGKDPMLPDKIHLEFELKDCCMDGLEVRLKEITSHRIIPFFNSVEVPNQMEIN